MLEGYLKNTLDELIKSFIFRIMKLMYLTLLNCNKLQHSNKINSNKKALENITKCLNPD